MEGRKWSPTLELHQPPPGYESGAPLSELEGQIGAYPVDLHPASRGYRPRTSLSMLGRRKWCRRLGSNQLPSPYQGAARPDVLQRRGLHGWIRTNATSLRRAHAESVGEERIGDHGRSRTYASDVRSVVPEVPRAMAMLIVVLGVEPSRSQRSARSPQLIRPRRSPELTTGKW